MRTVKVKGSYAFCPLHDRESHLPGSPPRTARLLSGRDLMSESNGPASRTKAGERGQNRPWLTWAVLLVLLAVALALRWQYIQEISLFVDEFVTAWAAQNVLLRGLPSFPSRNVYPHGFVFTYLVAPFVQGAFDETLARIPALIIGLAALPIAFLVGKRLFSAQTGLIVAAVMAVDPIITLSLWATR